MDYLRVRAFVDAHPGRGVRYVGEPIWDTRTAAELNEAVSAGLAPHRISDLVIAVNELAANTLRHTDAGGSLHIWPGRDEVICQIDDAGHIGDPLIGRRRPAPDAAHGHGMWVVHQLCDLVELRTGSSGTTIRLHMRLGAGCAAGS